MNAPRFMVSAAHKSSGKTTVSLGLAAAYAARGLKLQTFKKGPDYIDPMWLALASGRPCFNLDAYLMGEAAVQASFAAHATGADLNLVEGNKGLYDGLSLDGSNSNAALARQLGLPVVLVIDARGMTRGVAPLLLGYQAFDREIRIAGVILNRLGGARHEAKLRAVIEHYTDLPVLGAIQHDERLAVTERHLGLVPAAELAGASQQVAAVAAAIAAQVDLDRLQAIAAAAPALQQPHRRPSPPGRRPPAAHRHRARPRVLLLLRRRSHRARSRRGPTGRHRHADRYPAASPRRSVHRRRLPRSPPGRAGRERRAAPCAARRHRRRAADLRRMRRPDVPGAHAALERPRRADGRCDPG